MYRFDEEMSVPSWRDGSRLRIGPLTGDGSDVRVQVMHLPAGGLIGRHATPTRQLFAVVAGTGQVSGGDGRRHAIRPGYAALWESGEDHDAHSDGGLTAICIEGEFAVRAMAVTRDIVVRDYDTAWPSWFEAVRGHVWPAVEGLAVRIDHVGSTSVPGLAAKPIIDMDVVVASPREVHPVIERLGVIGYRWRGDLGIAGREAFERMNDGDGETAPGDGLAPHHLYLVVENNKAHLDHVLLRDLLRDDAAARDRYAALKRRNVDLADSDMDVYVAAKAALVAELLTRARAERGLPPATYWVPEVDIP